MSCNISAEPYINRADNEQAIFVIGNYPHPKIFLGDTKGDLEKLSDVLGGNCSPRLKVYLMRGAEC